MERSNFRFLLDIRDNNGGCVLDMKRGDTHRRLHMVLSDGGCPYYVEDSCFPVLMAKTEDKRLLYSHCIVEDGAVVCDLTSAYTATAGKVQCELRLYDKPFDEDEPETQLLTSATFVIQIHPTVYNGEEELAVAGSVEATALTSLVTLARDAAAQAMAIAEDLELQRDMGNFDGMSIRHLWDGTVLSVTSRSGTSSADLKGEKGDKGDKGDRGPQGPKGDIGTDDSCPGEYPWSGAHTMDLFCPPFQHTGTFITCTPLLHSYVTVTAKESTQVTHCRKNLFNPSTKLNVGYVYMGSGKLSFSGDYRFTDPIPAAHLVGQTLTLNYTPGGVNPGMCFYDKNDVALASGKGIALKVPENTAYLRFSVNKDDAAKGDIQMEIGEVSTEYEPYVSETLFLTPDEPLEVHAPQGRSHFFTDGTVLTVTGYSDPVAELTELKKAVNKLKNG